MRKRDAFLDLFVPGHGHTRPGRRPCPGAVAQSQGAVAAHARPESVATTSLAVRLR